MLRSYTLTIAMVAGTLLLGIGGSLQAGAVGGPQGNLAQPILGFDVDAYDVEFVGGELAEVGVVGAGVSDLDLYVYDASGELVASDTSLSDFCLVQFTPEETGVYRIVVENYGGDLTVYDIVTN